MDSLEIYSPKHRYKVEMTKKVDQLKLHLPFCAILKVCIEKQ